MMNMKKIMAGVAMTAILGTAGAVFAADIKTPGDIVAGITGKTAVEVSGARADGKSYGAQANEVGKLDEFKSQMLEQKKALLDQRVKDGTLTQKEADDIYNSIKNNQATCDATGNAQMGQKRGAGFGGSSGQGQGKGLGMGRGMGMKSGAGMGNCIK